MFILSVEIDIEDAISLREDMRMSSEYAWRISVIEALTQAIESGASEMKEVGMEIPSGV